MSGRPHGPDFFTDSTVGSVSSYRLTRDLVSIPVAEWGLTRSRMSDGVL